MSGDTKGLLEADVDPELELQLASAKDNEVVEAVLVLRQRSAEWPHPLDPAGAAAACLWQRAGRHR